MNINPKPLPPTSLDARCLLARANVARSIGVTEQADDLESRAVEFAEQIGRDAFAQGAVIKCPELLRGTSLEDAFRDGVNDERADSAIFEHYGF